MQLHLSERNRSIYIDALRGFAIFAVLQMHYGETLGFYAWIGLPESIRECLRYGWAGVDLFFVLSGFLLTRNLIWSRGRADAARHFYMRRIFRILPLYGLLLGAAAALGLLLDARAGEWLLSGIDPLWVYLSFLQNFTAGMLQEWRGWILSPTWSLAVEEHFYVFLPLVILRLSDRRIVVFALGCLLAAPLFRILIFIWVGPIAAYTWTFARMDCLGWGILIAMARAPAEQRWFNILWMSFAWSALLILVSFASPDVAATSPASVIASRTVFYTFTACLVAKMVFSVADSKECSSKSITVSILAWAGARCYSIYLLHMMVAGVVALIIGKSNPNVTDAISAGGIGLSLFATMVLSDLSYRFVECPFVDFAYYRSRSTFTADPASSTI